MYSDVHFTVRGTSFISGDMALRRAREVATVVAALNEMGISEGAIELRGVNAEVSTGALGNKSSSATYSLRATKIDAAKVSTALGVITSQANTQLQTIIWQFADEEMVREKLWSLAVKRTIAKAESTATLLGTQLLGVYSLNKGQGTCYHQ